MNNYKHKLTLSYWGGLKQNRDTMKKTISDKHTFNGGTKIFKNKT